MLGWNSRDSSYTYEEVLAKDEYKQGLKYQQDNKANTTTTEKTEKKCNIFKSTIKFN